MLVNAADVRTHPGEGERGTVDLWPSEECWLPPHRHRHHLPYWRDQPELCPQPDCLWGKPKLLPFQICLDILQLNAVCSLLQSDRIIHQWSNKDVTECDDNDDDDNNSKIDNVTV